MSRPRPLCFYCKHINDVTSYDEKQDKTTYYCKAYPDGIPEAVFDAGHLYPKPGDNGIQFELASEMKLPEYLKQSQAEEDADYRGYKEFYDEVNMSDIEFTEKMKREHGDNWYLYVKPTRLW